MMDRTDIIRYLQSYDGPEVSIMEVCGSHTGAISKSGIPSLLSDKIHLISGPGCPVCVTPSSYVDRLIELSMRKDTCVVTFGDMLRIPGSTVSLAQAKGQGAHVEMVYSPFDILKLAAKAPQTTFVFAAVGFETTMPVYALLMQTLEQESVSNVKLLTALKTMPPVIDTLCAQQAKIDGFLAPGHVAVVTGYKVFDPLAQTYKIPFGVAGFQASQILVALYGILHAYHQPKVMNFYPEVVTEAGNEKAQELIDRYFEPVAAVWRGMGIICGSGRQLRNQYSAFDAGSANLNEDHKMNQKCCCDKVLTGKMRPYQCPLYGKACTPLQPQGACMVSEEGNCHSYFINQRNDR